MFPDSAAKVRSRQAFSTPFPELDAALGTHLSPGQFILCAGLTGNGKTILAGQLLASFARQELNALFISTEVEFAELIKRTFSAWCSISYSIIVDEIRLFPIDLGTGLRFQIPDPTLYGEAAAAKGLEVMLGLTKRAVFLPIKSLGYEPKSELDGHLNGYESTKGNSPDVLIYDYLDAPEVHSKEEINIYRMRRAVADAAKALKDVARRRNILVIAFCQADPSLTESKKIMPGAISEFKAAAREADAFVGISHRRKSEEDETAEHGISRRIQYLTVTTKTRPSPKLIPVERAFEFQRFQPIKPGSCRAENENPCDVDHRAKTVERSSEFRGYVLARGAVFSGILGNGIAPYTVNLYAFLLLVARSNGPRLGTSFFSRETLSKHLGLSIKQIRTATDVLLDGGWIDVPPARFRKSLEYTVLDWKENQDPGKKGYFKLFRNLRDACRADLLGDILLFRVWLYLLSEARHFPDEDSELEPGDVFLRPRVAEEKLKLDEPALNAQIGKLEARGSIQRYRHSENRILIVNWDLYQTRVHPLTCRFEVESET